MKPAITEKSGVFIPLTEDELKIPYLIKKSRRRSFSLSLETDCSLVLHIPNSISFSSAEKIFGQKENWILKKYHLLKTAEKRKPVQSLTASQQEALELRYRTAAREYFPARVAYYETILAVTHSSITIRGQKTRWGSCSSKGGLNFNWRLMLAPPKILDYVVVHELCHRIEMNHSKAFWSLVEQVMPDYRECRKWLRDYGNTLTLN